MVERLPYTQVAAGSSPAPPIARALALPPKDGSKPSTAAEQVRVSQPSGYARPETPSVPKARGESRAVCRFRDLGSHRPVSGWDGWSLDRAVVAFTGVAYAVIWVQVVLYHWAGGFRRRAMWAPVVLTPIVVLAAVIGAIVRDGIWGWIAVALLAAAVLDGLVGLVFHLQGVGYQVGGLSLRNFMAGPPVMLALAYAAIGALGLGALVWNA